MSSQPHLEIFTLDRSTYHEESGFPLFSRLPKELRLKIWQHSLQRQRIIKLHLEHQEETAAARSSNITSLGSKFGSYCAIVNGYQVLSKLLRVNGESRRMTLEFYRVRIPCRFTARAVEEGIATPGTLYFNPEHDFLHISLDWLAKDTLGEFIYHLKTTYDPRHVGLLNLAVDVGGSDAKNFYLLESSHLDPGTRTAFTETLSQLHEVFFVLTPRTGRLMKFWWGSASRPILNRSFPILATAPTFERLPCDPRGIAPDLSRVFAGGSTPRYMTQLWQQLLERFGVFAPKIRYKIYLSNMTTDRIYDCESAKRWLQEEDDAWTTAESNLHHDRSTDKDGASAGHEKFKSRDLEIAVKPAFGFWLFPIEALSIVLENGVFRNRELHLEQLQLLDLSDYPPELALSSLP